MRQLNPKKLLLSKWTAVKPDSAELPFEQFELEAVHSGRTQIIHWRDLQDEGRWLQGWK